MSITDASNLPLTIEQIDRAWLSAALRTHAPDLRLNNFKIVDILHGTCTKIRLQLDLDEAGRRSGIPEFVILKGGFEPHSRSMPYMHEQEVRGYRDILPVLKLPSPSCYFSGFSAASGQGIIIMDDLHARGVEFCHPLKPQNKEQVAKRLTVLAQHHAQSWDSPDLLPGGRWAELSVMIPPNGGHLDYFLQPEIWNFYLEKPRGRAASVYFQDLAWMTDAYKRLEILAARLPHAVLHGDTHLGNLYIDLDGTPGFFDSLPHRWPPMEEVAYHIACAMDPLDRRRWDKDLVKHYLAESARFGATPPPLEEALEQFSAFLAFGFLIFMVNASEFQPEAINTAYTARFSAAMIDHDTIGRLAAIR